MDRDAELLKVQVVADYCHTNFTFFTTLTISGFFGFNVLILGLTIQNLIDPVKFLIAIIIVFVVTVVSFRIVLNEYHHSLDKIQGFFTQIEKGESLPTLKEMRKIVE